MYIIKPSLSTGHNEVDDQAVYIQAKCFKQRQRIGRL